MPTAAQVKASQRPIFAGKRPENRYLARKPRTYSPGEFSLALEERGIIRSERWVQDHCKAGDIETLPIPGRHVIPETELRRMLREDDAA